MIRVSTATVGNVRYDIFLFGAGYRAEYSISGGPLREVPKGFGHRDGSGAERAAKKFHKATFGEWPKSVRFKSTIGTSS